MHSLPKSSRLSPASPKALWGPRSIRLPAGARATHRCTQSRSSGVTSGCGVSASSSDAPLYRHSQPGQRSLASADRRLQLHDSGAQWRRSAGVPLASERDQPGNVAASPRRRGRLATGSPKNAPAYRSRPTPRGHSPDDRGVGRRSSPCRLARGGGLDTSGPGGSAVRGAVGTNFSAGRVPNCLPRKEGA